MGGNNKRNSNNGNSNNNKLKLEALFNVRLAKQSPVCVGVCQQEDSTTSLAKNLVRIQQQYQNYIYGFCKETISNWANILPPRASIVKQPPLQWRCSLSKWRLTTGAILVPSDRPVHVECIHLPFGRAWRRQPNMVSHVHTYMVFLPWRSSSPVTGA